MSTALVTGASRGLGRALAAGLGAHGYDLVIDARAGDALATAAAGLRATTTVTAIPGDLADEAHRQALADAVASAGLDALVLNASILGPSPLPAVDDLSPSDLRRLLEINVVAQLATYQAVAPHLRDGATVVFVTSDAAVEAYAGWGGYGASKAALQHLAAVLAEERPDLRVHAVDPGDLRTAMHQEAYPGEDISDRPAPETVVPALLHLITGDRPSGRYRASELEAAEVSA